MNIVGEVQIRPLSVVAPNTYNPNKLTIRMLESLRYGLEHDGWLASQALLIWGTDEKGFPQNIIIDGEHRWRVASDLGFLEGPMVFLQGLEEARAKALTIKLNQKRGTFDDAALGELIRDIELELGALEVDDLGLDMGFDDNELMKLLAEPVIDIPPPMPNGTSSLPIDDDISDPDTTPATSTPPQPHSHKVAQLLFESSAYDEYMEKVGRLAIELELTNTSDVVLHAIRLALKG